MTRDEVLESYDIVAFRAPKKGELIMTCKNVGAIFGVNRISADFSKNSFATILKKKDKDDN
tara:strand:- start:356 stop:538 length:183 start_codon:yes stop_codon:yes gene_type:complete